MIHVKKLCNTQKRDRGGSLTAVQAWRPCPLWEPFLVTHSIIVD